MRKALFLLVAIFFFFLSYAQKYEWSKGLGGTRNDRGHSIAVDDSGNVYTTGVFYSTADFDPGTGVANLISAGQYDIFISKLNSSGNFLWAKRIGGSGYEWTYSLAVDDSGNVFITGEFERTVDFDPGVGTYNVTVVAYRDIFILKLNTQGDFCWVKTCGSHRVEGPYAINLDNSGNIYSTGTFRDSLDLDPGSGTHYLKAVKYADIYLQKLNPSGDFKWAVGVGGDGNDHCHSLDIDDAENVYATGYFPYTVDFDPGVGTANLTTAGNLDIFVLKLDSSGNFEWAKRMGGTGRDVGNSIRVDKSGNVYTTGYFEGTVDFDPGPGVTNLTSQYGYEVFIQKLNSAGNLVWVKQIKGTGYESGASITIDDAGNLYITGQFPEIADFDPDTGVVNLSTNGAQDIFVQKLDSSGSLLWAKQFGGIDWDEGFSVAVDQAENVYFTGIFEKTADFGPGQGNTQITSFGNEDIFVCKLSKCNVSKSYLKEIVCESYTSPSGKFIWKKTGFYSDIIENYKGCDSLITIDLTIIGISSTLINPVVCGGYTSPSGSFYWTMSGSYYDTLLNHLGCDSFIHINLVVHTSSASTLSLKACDSFNSPSGNYVWTKSGVYYDTILNSMGCDSFITFNLSIKANTFSLINPVSCTHYTSPSGKYTWTKSGFYQDTIQNFAACDSLITINYTNSSNSSTFSINSCFNYSSPSGKYLWTTSGIYQDTIFNVAGCDSAMTINLTINTIDTSLTQVGQKLKANETGAAFQWLDCTNTFSQISGANSQEYSAKLSGYYAVEIKKNACVDTSMCYSVIGSGIIEHNATSEWLVYPNPTSGKITITFRNTIEEVDMIIRNLLGQKIMSKKYKTCKKLSFEIEGASGIYFIEIRTNEGDSKVLKVIKE